MGNTLVFGGGGFVLFFLKAAKDALQLMKRIPSRRNEDKALFWNTNPGKQGEGRCPFRNFILEAREGCEALWHPCKLEIRTACSSPGFGLVLTPLVADGACYS